MEMKNLSLALQDFKTATTLQADYSDNLTRGLLIKTLLDTRNIDEAAKGTDERVILYCRANCQL
jgi:hypothetical protein